MKGLPRSIRRGLPQLQAAKVLQLKIDTASVVITNGAPGWGTVVVGDFPAGNVLLLGLTSYLKFTKNDADITDTFDGDYSFGSTPTADGTLSSTDADLLASTAFAAAAVGGVTGIMRAASASSLAGTIFDNTDGSLEINLNIIIDDGAISADGAVFVDGVLNIAYMILGDD